MVLRALIILFLGAACSRAFAGQGQCDAAAFREAVALVSASITSLREKNGKIAQENLQKLRVLNKWQDADFVANAKPLVKDEVTDALDAANQVLLNEVQSLEAANANTESGRCVMLDALRRAMEKIVANTAIKWEHVLAKIASASAQPLQAGLAQ